MRVPVSVESYITGASYFLNNNCMHLIPENFRVRNTNVLRSKDPLWVKSHELWLLLDDRQVFGAFDPVCRTATVAIDGPKWRTHLFVKWLAEYLGDPPARAHRKKHRWRVTLLQSTEPLDSLRPEQ